MLPPSAVRPATAAPLSASDLADYLLDLGGALLSYGCPTHRLEAVVRAAAALEGYQADVFGVPTGLFITLRPPAGEPLMRMVRVKAWGTDLARLAALDRIFNDVLDRRISLAEAHCLLDDVEARPFVYPAPLVWAAMVVAAASIAVFLRGRPIEWAFAAIGGLGAALLQALLGKTVRGRLLLDFFGGLLAAGVALGFGALVPGISREVLILSVVILFVPGLVLTAGLAELANKNLVSGAAKLMEAMMVFLSLAFGIGVTIAVEQVLHLQVASLPPAGRPGWAAQALAVLGASLGFAVIFGVPRRLLWTAVPSGAIGAVPSLLVTRIMPSVTAFVAALLVGVFANGFARVSQRPAQVFQLPGMALLVPGVFGLLSLESFLRGELLGGAAKGFETFLMGGALVTGLLVANVILPARKLL